jgi:hypothetical protein
VLVDVDRHPIDLIGKEREICSKSVGLVCTADEGISEAVHEDSLKRFMNRFSETVQERFVKAGDVCTGAVAKGARARSQACRKVRGAKAAPLPYVR